LFLLSALAAFFSRQRSRLLYAARGLLGLAALSLVLMTLGALLLEAPRLLDLPVLHVLLGREIAMALRIDALGGFSLALLAVLLVGTLARPEEEGASPSRRLLVASLEGLGAFLWLSADHPFLLWAALQALAFAVLIAGGLHQEDQPSRRGFVALQLCGLLLLLSQSLHANAIGDLALEEWRSAGSQHGGFFAQWLGWLVALVLAGVPPFHGWRLSLQQAGGPGAALHAGLAPLLGVGFALRLSTEYAAPGVGAGLVLALWSGAGAVAAALLAHTARDLRQAASYLGTASFSLSFFFVGVSSLGGEGPLPVASLGIGGAFLALLGASFANFSLASAVESLSLGAGSSLARFGGVWGMRPRLGWGFALSLAALAGLPAFVGAGGWWLGMQALLGAQAGVARVATPALWLLFGLALALFWMAAARLVVAVLLGRPRGASVPRDLSRLGLLSLFLPLSVSALLGFLVGPLAEQLTFALEPSVGSMNIYVSWVAVEAEVARLSPLVLLGGVALVALLLYWRRASLRKPKVSSRRASPLAEISPDLLSQPLRVLFRGGLNARATLSTEPTDPPLAPTAGEYGWSVEDRAGQLLSGLARRAEASKPVPRWLWIDSPKAYVAWVAGLLFLLLFLAR
jgi:formate hydrogenlyase subunit 3/multisubunit Na+/H+ antiporter MnhD subunit